MGTWGTAEQLREFHARTSGLPDAREGGIPLTREQEFEKERKLFFSKVNVFIAINPGARVIGLPFPDGDIWETRFHYDEEEEKVIAVISETGRGTGKFGRIEITHDMKTTKYTTASGQISKAPLKGIEALRVGSDIILKTFNPVLEARQRDREDAKLSMTQGTPSGESYLGQGE